LTERNHRVEKGGEGCQRLHGTYRQERRESRKEPRVCWWFRKGAVSESERERSFTGEQEQGRDSDDPITNIDRRRNLVVCQGGERGPGSGRERSFDCGESKERKIVKGKGERKSSPRGQDLGRSKGGKPPTQPPKGSGKVLFKGLQGRRPRSPRKQITGKRFFLPFFSKFHFR